ncbi:nuclear transport factor 2 family protein [Streptomyces sp. NPDC051572]|uniref:nuclear transport factor 2 family protein n=1 Tax=unclassified Streptomyces TaxID=2593676 RepID=UPI00344E16EE
MAAFSSQDRTTVEELLDPQCVWRVPGRNGLAGERVGLPEVMGLFGTLKRVLTVPARFEVIDITTSRERAIAYQYGVVVIGARTVRMKECLVYRFRDGRIVEVDEFQYDQAGFDEVFSPDAIATATASATAAAATAGSE